MLYVKMMSAQDCEDTSPCKDYTIVPVANDQVMAFKLRPLYAPESTGKVGETTYLEIYHKDGSIQEFELVGNAYVMNEQGKTISSRSPYFGRVSL